MFTRIIRFATRFPKSVIVAWAIVALALGSLSGLLGYNVMTDDTAGYLPKSAESAGRPVSARSTSARRRTPAP